MRAVLILIALLVWTACMAGAISLVGYLAFLAAANLRARLAGTRRTPPPRPPWIAVVALVGASMVLAAGGVLLSGPWALLLGLGGGAGVVTAAVVARRPASATV